MIKGKCVKVDVVLIFILAFLILALVALSSKISYNRGYKHGQIDVAIGDMKYEIVEQPDGSMIWKRKFGK